MKINTLKVENFKCFKTYDISFAPNTTIIIGRNGAGKSTILSAIKKSLSFIFANNKSLGKDFLSAGNPSLNIKSFSDGDYRYDSETRTYSTDVDIKSTGTFAGEPLEWELYKRSTANASLYSGKYKDAFIKFTHKWKNEKVDLPVLVYFSDKYPTIETKQTKYAMDSILKDSIARNFGYYQWDISCTSIWETRMCNQLAHSMSLKTKIERIKNSLSSLEKNHNEADLKSNDRYNELKYSLEQNNKLLTPLEEEINYIQDKLINFSCELPNLYDEEYYIEYLVPETTSLGFELKIVFKNGKSSLLNGLPAGYHRLYSMVFDIAYRAFILNGSKEPSGIVVIDEVDLHLHPSLEQEVVRCLNKFFPNIQFIMTTHSVAVISNLNTVKKADDKVTPLNSILFMQDGQSKAEILSGTFGLDMNATLRDFMDTPSSNIETKQMGDEYLKYCSIGLKKEAESTLKKIINIVGSEDHDLIKELKEKSKAYEIH